MAKIAEAVSGAVFGRLTIVRLLRKVGGSGRPKVVAVTDCSCGTKEKEVDLSVVGNLVLSCGCLRLERLKARVVSHGDTGSTEYVAWCAMKQRAFYSGGDHYHLYGGRGITVCQTFLGVDGFAHFLKEVGRKPSRCHSLDRISVEKGYEPGNLRWASPTTQARNRRCTLYVTIDGRKVSLAEACETAGLPYQLVYDRWKILNWPVSKAFNDKTYQEYDSAN